MDLLYRSVARIFVRVWESLGTRLMQIHLAKIKQRIAGNEHPIYNYYLRTDGSTGVCNFQPYWVYDIALLNEQKFVKPPIIQ